MPRKPKGYYKAYIYKGLFNTWNIGLNDNITWTGFNSQKEAEDFCNKKKYEIIKMED